MKVFHTQKELLDWRQSLPFNCCLGLVPTMGALHGGHLSLIKKSKEQCDITLVSIFVNPRQFGKNEDIDTYPRTPVSDLKKTKELSVDAVFCPSVEEMYNEGDCFVLSETGVSHTLEGSSRKGFFDGVLTVVSKLFNICSPHRAYFGMKDAQQLWLIKSMVSSMKYPIQVVALKTIREESGLAMSSRNKYLSSSERQDASIIYRALRLGQKKFVSGCLSSEEIKKLIKEKIQSVEGFIVDYVSIVNLCDFQESSNGLNSNNKYLVSTAVFIDGVRLIDNIELG